MRNLDNVPTLLILALLAGPAVSVATADDKKPAEERPGYDDSDFIPGSKWRVHDKNRPYPPIITAGTASTADKAGQAPSDAIVLFDGTDLSKWNVGKKPWKVENGYMEITPGAGGLTTRDAFGSCQLHVEFASPSPAKGTSQHRGNSGVMIMTKYEFQVLDSFKNPTYADGQAAAIYGQYPPLVNASRGPGEWQSLDIIFEAPIFDGDKLVKAAFATVFHNGVLVHHHRRLMGPVKHKYKTSYVPHPAELPLLLQDHGNPIRFRNIWLRKLAPVDDGLVHEHGDHDHKHEEKDKDAK
ncbi:MAG: hypothetical protein CMJ48_00105 [Planctomycetaceae bacterium]|nr:hypothetical protein [Planctomycetaceae bacterium]